MTKITLSTTDGEGNSIAVPLSKGQKAFNTLTAKIDARRAVLAEWETFDGEFQRKYGDEVVPLKQGYDAVRVAMVQRLDQAHGAKGVTKAERQIIADMITHLGASLLDSGDAPGMEEIYRRYNVEDPEAEAVVLEIIRQEIETTFGVEIPDDFDLTSPDDVFRHVQAQLDEQEARQRAHEKARDDFHANRRKAPKKSTAEERARAEEAEVTLSIREIYRKLVSALHPDREPDPGERERKASLMQRVNKAYASKSLLDLLEIQLELEHIDLASLQNVSDDRLKRWNTILKDQLRDLNQQIEEVEYGFKARCGMSPLQKASPKTVRRELMTIIRQLRAGTKAFERDMRVFDDPARFKAWLKMIKRELAEQAFY